MTLTRRTFTQTMAAAGLASAAAGETPISIGSRRELFVDRELIAELKGTELRQGSAVDAGPVIAFDKPWEGAFCAYTTILTLPGAGYRMYYRGVPNVAGDGSDKEVTCVADSPDGIRWQRPSLGIHPMPDAPQNNIILAKDPPWSHNFTPFIDTRPGVDSRMRFKALAGLHKTGLTGWVSDDGYRWRKIQDAPVFPPPKEFSLDTQNIAFWSEHEGKYLLYYRVWKKISGVNYRWIARAVSDDFLRWTVEGPMDFGDVPPEHLYTNQTEPYMRAPHIYAGLCARFMQGRQVLTEAEAKAIHVDPKYFGDCSDVVLLTSRGGTRYTRTFMEAFLRPGVGFENWVSRSNYPALHLIRTGPSTMSFYVNRNYGQPTAYLRRYEMRLDGFASAHAPYGGGELLTKPLVFEGSRLELNFSTSAPGSVRVELLDSTNKPIPGYSLAEAPELVGDAIERDYSWKSGKDISALQGKPVRIRFVLRDADLYAFRFTS